MSSFFYLCIVFIINTRLVFQSQNITIMTQSTDRIIQAPKLLKKPIFLKPNPPASTHQLSYNQYQNKKIKQQLEMGKHESLLKKIQQLHNSLYQKDSIIKQIKDTHLRQLFLLEISLKHQMEITARYDAELKKCQASRNQIQNYFQMKLELVKKQMMEAFQGQMIAEREKAAEDLRLIKENYCTKIALVGEGFKEKELQFAENQHKSANYELRISMIQSKLDQKTRALQSQNERNFILEQKIKENELSIVQLKRKLSETQQQFDKKSSYLKAKAQQEEKIKDQLSQRFRAMKVQIQNSQIKRLQVEKINFTLKTELELALRKYNYIQKQLDQLNRKTYKNKQEYDKNPVQGRILESGRETQRDRQREKSKDKDKENIAKYLQEIQRITKMNQNLIQQLEEKDQQILDIQTRNAQEIQTQRENYQIKIKQFQRQKENYQNKIRQFQRQKENYQIKLKQILNKNQTETKIYCSQLQQQIRKLKEQLSKKQTRIQDLNIQIQKQSQTYTKNLEYITKKGQELQDSLKLEQQEMQALYEKIDSQYLKQMQSQRKKIDELELTLNQTHELMANEAKQKKIIQAELQELKKSKKK